jgi:PhnB protein
MQVQSYLSFEGRCEEALDFYKRVLGAKVETVMRFKENPDLQKPGVDPAMCGMSPGSEEKIMHSSFRIGETVVMASDGRCTGKPEFKGIALTIAVPDEATADRLFHGLADGGQVQMPLGKTFFSPKFGMVADRFGVGWMVIVVQ